MLQTISKTKTEISFSDTKTVMTKLSIVRGQISKIQAQILGTQRGQKLAALEAESKEISKLVKEYAEYEKINEMKFAGITLFTQNRKSWNEDKLKALAERYNIGIDELMECKDEKPTLAIK